MSESDSNWRALGAVPSTSLAGTRAGLHANLLAAACAHPERGPEDPPVLRGGFDFVLDETGALLLAHGDELRPGLRIRDAHLVLFDEEEGEIDAVFDLERQTWPQARIWLEAQCAASGVDFSASRFELPEEVFEGLGPEELVDTFEFHDLAPAEELEAWIANAFELIATLDGLPGPPRFDAGRFCVVSGGDGRGGEIGLSLGETGRQEPFFFARHSQGKVPSPGFKAVWEEHRMRDGAHILRAEDLCGAPAAGCQEKHARAFLKAALRIFENV